MIPEVTDASDFYDRLARGFDVMTDWEARLAFEGPWLRALFKQHGVQCVLDAACGTGGHAVAFAEWGLEVIGMDASAETIALARQKGTSARFEVAPLGEMAPLLAKPVDAVVCLGNSLPHLVEPESLAQALKDMHACLCPDGLLVLHNLNYDLRWQTRLRFFPAQSGIVDRQECIIWRLADYHDDTGLITFHIAMFTKDTTGRWSVEVVSTPQRPLFAKPLRQALENASFTIAGMHGDLTGVPFDPHNSPDLVIIARA